MWSHYLLIIGVIILHIFSRFTTWLVLGRNKIAPLLFDSFLLKWVSPHFCRMLEGTFLQLMQFVLIFFLPQVTMMADHSPLPKFPDYQRPWTTMGARGYGTIGACPQKDPGPPPCHPPLRCPSGFTFSTFVQIPLKVIQWYLKFAFFLIGNYLFLLSSPFEDTFNCIEKVWSLKKSVVC